MVRSNPLLTRIRVAPLAAALALALVAGTVHANTGDKVMAAASGAARKRVKSGFDLTIIYLSVV